MFVSVFSAELGSTVFTFAWDFTDFLREGGLGPCGGRCPVEQFHGCSLRETEFSQLRHVEVLIW